MAVYFLNMKTFGRAGGSSAASAAAYRAGERIRDERTGRTYDHSERQDVLHKEIVLPSRFTDEDMAWARDRAGLWNAAEGAETRKNARVAREYLVALPVELSPPQRLELVRGFSQELSDRYGFAIDLAVHAPRDFPGSDARNFHAHLLATTREVQMEGLGAKTTLDMSDRNRREVGLPAAWKHKESIANHGRGSRGPHLKWNGTDIGVSWLIECARNMSRGCRHAWRGPPAERCTSPRNRPPRSPPLRSPPLRSQPPGHRSPNRKVSRTSAGKRGKTGCACGRAKFRIRVSLNLRLSSRKFVSRMMTSRAEFALRLEDGR